MNVPVGAAAIAITRLKLRETRDPNATRVDRAGVTTFSAALFLLVLALMRGNDEGWGSTLIVSLFAASAVLMAAFVAVEHRVAEPMLPLGLFRRRAFAGVQLAAFAISGSLFALFLYLTLYLQNYLGYSPLEAGVRYLSITPASFVAAPIAGALLSRVPARAMMSAGLAVAGGGVLLMSGIGAGDGWTTLLGGFLVAGAGVGLLNPVIADVAVSVVPKERSGVAAGINDTFRQVGIAVGIAVWGAIFVGRGSARVSEFAAGTPASAGGRPRQLVEAASSGNLDQALAAFPPQARDAVSHAAREGFLAGLNDALLLGALGQLGGRGPRAVARARARDRARARGAGVLGWGGAGIGGRLRTGPARPGPAPGRAPVARLPRPSGGGTALAYWYSDDVPGCPTPSSTTGRFRPRRPSTGHRSEGCWPSSRRAGSRAG